MLRSFCIELNELYGNGGTEHRHISSLVYGRGYTVARLMFGLEWCTHGSRVWDI